MHSAQVVGSPAKSEAVRCCSRFERVQPVACSRFCTSEIVSKAFEPRGLVNVIS